MNKSKNTILILVSIFIPAIANADWSHGHGWGKGHDRGCNDYSVYRDRGYDRYSNWGYGRGGSYFEDTSYGSDSQAIWGGIKSGRLSDREVRGLREDQEDIRRKERAYWSDGRLSRGEREDLRDEVEDFRKDLRHELNDGETRWRW